MTARYVLALDIGTSSTRSAIYDAKGNRLIETTAQFEYSLVTGQDGRAEIQAGHLGGAVQKALTKTLRVWRKRKPLAAIGVSCFWHSLVGLDAKGKAITPIYTWADSRSRIEARQLRAKGGEKAIHARTGCMARTSFWPAKLLWLRKTEPWLFRRVTRWVSPAEWIQEAWCGSSTASISMASGTGLLDGRTLRWYEALMRRCALNRKRLNPISDEQKTVSRTRARGFPELVGVPWYPAIGDGAASNLGSGAMAADIAAINVGTSAALRVMVTKKSKANQPPSPFGLFSYRIDANRRLVGRRREQCRESSSVGHAGVKTSQRR